LAVGVYKPTLDFPDLWGEGQWPDSILQSPCDFVCTQTDRFTYCVIALSPPTSQYFADGSFGSSIMFIVGYTTHRLVGRTSSLSVSRILVPAVSGRKSKTALTVLLNATSTL
jgi:hypothetical protein